MGDGGDFGDWAVDSDGLPCFDLSPDAPAGDVWHQVGNDRVTATAHPDGSTTLYWAEEGLLRLTRRKPVALPVGTAVRWGAGYAEYSATAWRRRVWAPFGSLPAILVDVEAPAGEYEESWVFDPYPIVLGGLMSRRVPAPSSARPAQKLLWHTIFTGTSASRAATEVLRRFLGAGLGLTPRYDAERRTVFLEAPGRHGASARRSALARLPGAIFVTAVTALDAPPVEVETSVDGPRATVTMGVRLDVPTRLRFAVGVATPEDVDSILAALAEASPGETAASWRGCALLDAPSAPVEAREVTWHAVYLRGAAVDDRVLGCRYVPQGSAYTYVHGLQGAPRDYAIATVPLVMLDPPLAASMLRLVSRMGRRDGAIEYAHTGAGLVTGAFIHEAPSDLPLFLLWALTDYVWATGDTALLDELAPAALRAWRYLRDGVGLGPHGLLRVGSGDWSDPISAMVPDRGAFHRRGESSFNTAMALYVLPRAAELLGEPELGALAGELRPALEAAWAGRWFLRGYDGRGGPVGAEHLFVDANAWCLVAEAGSPADRDLLARTIDATCCAPSPIGATVLDRPHRVRGGILPPGWDTNGGVWAAVNALLAWGFALHDSDLAWRCLERQSLAAHARAYPHVWYGTWSGPDAYNSHHGDLPGETFVQPATPMQEFPVMNSNAHAGPLLALTKVLGIEATPDGLALQRPAPHQLGEWRLETTLATFSGKGGVDPAG